MQSAVFPRAGLFIRLAAIVYDCLVVAAIIFFAAACALGLSVLLDMIHLWPKADGLEHSDRIQGLVYQIYLVVAAAWFYLYFWVKAGQTLGMKAWRLRVQQLNGNNISYKQASVRLLTSLFGLGNLLCLLPARLALQDRIANTEVVRLTPEANRSVNILTRQKMQSHSRKK